MRIGAAVLDEDVGRAVERDGGTFGAHGADFLTRAAEEEVEDAPVVRELRVERGGDDVVLAHEDGSAVAAREDLDAAARPP